VDGQSSLENARQAILKTDHCIEKQQERDAFTSEAMRIVANLEADITNQPGQAQLEVRRGSE
jgi:hypothetical protein